MMLTCVCMCVRVCDHDNMDTVINLGLSVDSDFMREQPTQCLCPNYTTTIRKCFDVYCTCCTPCAQLDTVNHTHLLVQLLHADQIKRLNAEEKEGRGGKRRERRGEKKRRERRRKNIKRTTRHLVSRPPLFATWQCGRAPLKDSCKTQRGSNETLLMVRTHVTEHTQ